jgi:hypothetical protein
MITLFAQSIRSKAGFALHFSDIGISGSNPGRGRDIYTLLCDLVLCCTV